MFTIQVTLKRFFVLHVQFPFLLRGFLLYHMFNLNFLDLACSQ